MATNGSAISAFCKAASCLVDLTPESQQPCLDDADAQGVATAEADSSGASWGRLIVHQDLQRMVSDSASIAALAAINPEGESRLQPVPWAHSAAYGNGRPQQRRGSYY